MAEEQWARIKNIHDITRALDSLIEHPDLITPEDKTKLSQAYIRFGDLLTELMERKHD